MVATPDSIVFTGPNLQQVPIAQGLVTPQNGTQIGAQVVVGPALAGMMLAGGSNSAMNACGNIFTDIVPAGLSPAATGGDYVVYTFTLPANFFDQNGRGMIVWAIGSFAANGNTKNMQVIFNPSSAVVGQLVGSGGQFIARTNPVNTVAGGWVVMGKIVKYGAKGSNTQMTTYNQAQCGSAVQAVVVPTLVTAVENAPILVAVTVNCTTAVTDVVFNWISVQAYN